MIGGMVISQQSGLSRSVSAFWLLALILAFGVASNLKAEEQNTYSTVSGSGQKYKTTVERTTQGKLGEEDLRQVSLLSSRVLLHLNEAVERLMDDQVDEAGKQIELAQQVAAIVREMLPVTTVRTRVENPKGEAVYDYSEKVQDDQIPIYESALMVQVVKPILEAQKDEAALQGLALEDADFVYTSALLDLGYVDRKLRRASESLADDKEEVLRQLVLAQTNGLKIKLNEEDSPLVKAQAALQLADRMVGENKVQGAKANMDLARFYLESYQSLNGDPNDTAVQNLRQKMDELRRTLDGEGMAGEAARDESRGLIQSFWKTITSWMSEEPGQAHIVDKSKTDQEQAVEGT